MDTSLVWRSDLKDKCLKGVNACTATVSNPDLDINSGNGNYEYTQYNIKTASKYWEFESVDLALGVFSVPDRKIDKLKALLKCTSDCKVVPAWQLASLIGKIMSISLALGTVTRLITHNLYAALNLSSSWYQEVTMTQELLLEVKFWLGWQRLPNLMVRGFGQSHLQLGSCTLIPVVLDMEPYC